MPFHVCGHGSLKTPARCFPYKYRLEAQWSSAMHLSAGVPRKSKGVAGHAFKFLLVACQAKNKTPLAVPCHDGPWQFIYLRAAALRSTSAHLKKSSRRGRTSNPQGSKLERPSQLASQWGERHARNTLRHTGPGEAPGWCVLKGFLILFCRCMEPPWRAKMPVVCAHMGGPQAHASSLESQALSSQMRGNCSSQ